MKRPRIKLKWWETLMSRATVKNVTGSQCMTCRKTVDEEGIEDEWRGDTRNGFQVRVKCHGAEEVGDFEFADSTWSDEDQQRAIQRRRWFNPFGHGTDAGNVLRSNRS